jgi:hypothetical protein
MTYFLFTGQRNEIIATDNAGTSGENAKKFGRASRGIPLDLAPDNFPHLVI